MKTTNLHHAFIVSALLVASVNAYAQDGSSGEAEFPSTNSAVYERIENDPVIYTGGEGDRPTKNHVVPKDSASVKMPLQRARPIQETTPSKEVKPQSPDDESILSFNFLYYIIQKFKFQDIVD